MTITNLEPALLREQLQPLHVLETLDEDKDEDGSGLGVGVDPIEELRGDAVTAACALQAEPEVVLGGVGHSGIAVSQHGHSVVAQDLCRPIELGASHRSDVVAVLRRVHRLVQDARDPVQR